QNRPAGSVVSTFNERSIQVQGRIGEPQDFLDMIVARRGGAPIYLHDIATVQDGAADAANLAFYNGEPALAVDIVKVQDANTVQVVSDVTSRLEQLNTELAGQDIQLRVVTDASIAIQESV